MKCVLFTFFLTFFLSFLCVLPAHIIGISGQCVYKDNDLTVYCCCTLSVGVVQFTLPYNLDSIKNKKNTLQRKLLNSCQRCLSIDHLNQFCAFFMLYWLTGFESMYKSSKQKHSVPCQSRP